MDHILLIGHCCNALDGFDSNSVALDHYITNYFIDNYIENEEEQLFITEVFAGCVRYASVLKIPIDGFFARLGRTVLLSETSLYTVIAYLVFFRIEELGVDQFSSIVSSMDPHKMFKFLNFILEEKNLITWMKDNWQKFYDPAFVKNSILDPVMKNLPELRDLIKSLHQKVANEGKPKKRVVQAPTEPKPFNITQPRPRSVPMPEPIPKLKKHRPVPSTTYEKPQEEEVISRKKEVNRHKAEKRLMESTRTQFSCAKGEKSERALLRMQELQEEENKKLLFEKHKANPLPSHVNADIPIKLNTAAILREGKLYKKKEQETLKHLERVEAGAKDASEFLEWQTSMRQQDLDEKLANIERRRIEGKLSHEEAILARQNLIKQNKNKVDKMKEETKKMFQDYLKTKFQQEQEMRLLVDKVLSGHSNAQDARRKVTEYKAKIVQEVREESRELMRIALEEAEQEMRYKMEIIHQIRAMESVPVIRHKFVDLTSTAGYGLLSEMSIAELKERLALLKEAQLRAEDEKRDEILAAKQAKDRLLMDTLETISKHRTEQSRAAANRLEEKKQTHNQKKPFQNEALTELQQRLEDRKAERLREQEQSRIRVSRKSAQRTMALIDDKKAREENRWQELERSKERTSRLANRGLTDPNSARMGARVALAQS